VSIEKLIEDLINLEGGYVNHPADKGGPTKYGITLKTLSDFRGNDLEDSDVKLLSKSAAATIYKQVYYLAPGIDGLPDLVQAVTFDMAVNMGPVAAVKLLQRVIHKLGTPVSVDGHIGPRTRQSAVIACNVYKDDVLRSICLCRKDFTGIWLIRTQVNRFF